MDDLPSSSYDQPSTSRASYLYDIQSPVPSPPSAADILPSISSSVQALGEGLFFLEVNDVEINSSSSESSEDISSYKDIEDFDEEQLVTKLQEVFSIKVLEENAEPSVDLDTKRDPHVTLSEVYVESPVSLCFPRKSRKATQKDKEFFEYSKAILLGEETSLISKDFSNVHPDIRTTAKVFLNFICEENKGKSDPKLLMKFLTVLAAMFSNSKLVLTEKQIRLVIKFLLHCLFVEIDHVSHWSFRNAVAQMLTVFTDGSAYISKRLYTDVVEHFKTKIDYFPFELEHWSAILITLKYMGTPAIQSIIIPNFLRICTLLEETLKSLESYKCIFTKFKQTTKGNKNYAKLQEEINKLNFDMHKFLDAVRLRFLLLKRCSILIVDVIKEDIRTEKRIIYISEDIDKLLPKKTILPEPIQYKFNHEKHKSFFNDCFKYFGYALSVHILPVLLDYERSNYLKAHFFQQRHKLYIINNAYFFFEKRSDYIKAKRKKLKKRKLLKDSSQTLFDQFDFQNKTFVLMNPPNPRLGSILTPLGERNIKNIFKFKHSSKIDETQKANVLMKQEEAKRYLLTIQNVPEPLLRVLRKKYESQSRVKPQHWNFTGNLETCI